MTDRKIRKTISEYIYIIDGIFVRSASEAKLLAEQCSCTADELVYRAERRSDLPTENWAGFHEALCKTANSRGTMKPINPFIVFLRNHRRLAVAGIIILLIISFFTLVPTGRALAKEAFEIIISIFDEQLHAQQTEELENLPPIDFGTLPDQFQTLEEAADQIGRPVAKLSDASYTMNRITLDKIENVMLTLRTEYSVPNGGTLMLIQAIYNGQGSWGSSVSADDNQVETIVNKNGLTFYLGTMRDGTVFAETYGSSMTVNISSCDVPLNEMRIIVQDIILLSPEDKS